MFTTKLFKAEMLAVLRKGRSLSIDNSKWLLISHLAEAPFPSCVPTPALPWVPGLGSVFSAVTRAGSGWGAGSALPSAGSQPGQQSSACSWEPEQGPAAGPAEKCSIVWFTIICTDARSFLLAWKVLLRRNRTAAS